jgi:hypothetical protein
MKRRSGIFAILFVCALLGYVGPRIALGAFPIYKCKNNTCSSNFVCCANADNSACCDFTASGVSYGACNDVTQAKCPTSPNGIVCTGKKYKTSGINKASCNKNPKIPPLGCGGVYTGANCDQINTCNGSFIYPCTP